MHSGALFDQGPEDAQAAGLPVDDDRLLPARPESLGSIHIRSPDPKAQPAIRFNFLADQIDQAPWSRLPHDAEDRRCGTDGRLSRRGVLAGPSVQSDEEILTWIRNNSQTAYHPDRHLPHGTGGPNTVVDDKLKVHGSRACASPTPRSSRPCPRATPTRPRSWSARRWRIS
jgi:choline dehydrogenase-like flavoprotein